MSTGLPFPKARTTDLEVLSYMIFLTNTTLLRFGVSDDVFRDEPFGFIVTSTFLNRLGFHYDSVTCLSYRLYGDKYVPVPILGVVKELPNRTDVMCTDSFYIMQLHNYPDDREFSMLFIDTRDLERAHHLKDVIRKITGLADDIPVYDSVKGFKNSLYVFYFSNKLPEIRQLFKAKSACFIWHKGISACSLWNLLCCEK